MLRIPRFCGILQLSHFINFDLFYDNLNLFPIPIKLFFTYKAHEKTQNFSLKASFGGGYKAPDFRQLFLNFSNPISGYSVFGTSTLEAGLQQLEDSGQLAEVFIEPTSLGEIKAERAYALNIGGDWF